MDIKKFIIISLSLLLLGMSYSLPSYAEEEESNCRYVINEETGKPEIICDDDLNDEIVEPYYICTLDCWGDD